MPPKRSRKVNSTAARAAPADGVRVGPYWRARAVYSFVRAVLGERVSDNEIARRWKIDARVFNDIKFGRVAVPRIDRLRDLAPVLGINEHFIYAVAAGAPWRRILAAARRGEADRALEVLAGTARKAQDALRDTREQLDVDRARLAQVSTQLDLRDAQLNALLDQLFVAVLVIDAAGSVVSANEIARELFGIPVAWQGSLTLAVRNTVFIDIQGEPFGATELPIHVALATAEPVARTFTVHRKGKRPQVVVATASPIRDRGRTVVGVVSVLREVNDLFDRPKAIAVRSRR